MTADKIALKADGYDISYISVELQDRSGEFVGSATDVIHFSISGAGEIIATDNGDPSDLTAFPSKERRAFSGLALAIVRAKPGASGSMVISASGKGLKGAEVQVKIA